MQSKGVLMVFLFSFFLFFFFLLLLLCPVLEDGGIYKISGERRIYGVLDKDRKRYGKQKKNT